ncbi:hypothetical protein [Deinococcus multiflagellatus]|uniref:Uncharacterized protein n=1 Tax=Deinococcus multiflagellatus TaxID=1656887 RepID=A0ABW1ZU89_9DEIO|nr:hypothetical protein [Deinococcus multiflagellatus]MBZ9715497.1 hypothetical protein [Deinococcus multiflagellatus]
MKKDQITATFHKFREAIRSRPALRGQDANQLTGTFLALASLKRFHEGFGGQLFKQQLKAGAELRATNPEAYAATLRRVQPYLNDIQDLGQDAVRVVETLTSTDLSFAIGTTREIERDGQANPFNTNLYTIVRRRTVTDLIPVATSNGVDLEDPFLAFRKEGTPHKQTSWTGRTGTLSVANMELGFELTMEMLMRDRLGEFLDAQEELGKAAARTRAWTIMDAIRRKAERITIPVTGPAGPVLANITAVDALLGYRVIHGREYIRRLTDLYVPGQYRGQANTARNTQTLAPQGGANGPATQVSTSNPLYQAYEVHAEEILSRMDVSGYPGHSKTDYIAADRDAEPVDFATLQGYEGGARLFARVSDVANFERMGSFDRHLIEYKASDWTGAEVRDESGLVIVGTQ